MPFSRLFKDHPASVGETYLEHMRAALWFSTTMARAAFCCLVHAFLPFLFTKTGSGAIERLYEAMVVARDSYTQRRRDHVTGAELDSRGSLNH
ncbi:MAG TPA: DUF6356 family protein [Gammaproteobacteria bacterium]